MHYQINPKYRRLWCFYNEDLNRTQFINIRFKAMSVFELYNNF